MPPSLHFPIFQKLIFIKLIVLTNPLLSEEPGLKVIEGKARLTLLSVILNNAVPDMEGLLYLRVILKAIGPHAERPIIVKIASSDLNKNISNVIPITSPKLLPNQVTQKEPVSSPIFPIKKTPDAFPKDIKERIQTKTTYAR